MALRERLIGTDEPQAWAAALEGVPHGFHHAWASCHAAQLNTGLPTYLYVAEQDGVRVVCPFSERRLDGALDLVTPQGISGFAANGVWPGFAAHWKAFARAHGAVCGYLAQHPVFGHEEHEGPAAGGSPLYLLDLQAGAEAVLAAAGKDRRRELRRWQEQGQAYTTEREPVAAFLLREHAAFVQRVGASAATGLQPAALQALLEAPTTLLVGAGPAGGPLEAACLYGLSPWGGEGMIHVTLPAGRHHTAALMAWGVQALAARGLPWLNLGGGARDGDAIAAAKLKWRPRVVPFRRLKQVYREAEYAALCAQAGVDPLRRDGYFPAYRAPRAGGPP